MSVQKISLSLRDNKFTIIKIDGVGFALDPKDEENLDERCNHLKKFEPGTIISVYDFFIDPDYYTKMYTIVDGNKMQKTVINV